MEGQNMEVLIYRAINLIANNEPLPVDLHANLLAGGIDVGELERKYTR